MAKKANEAMPSSLGGPADKPSFPEKVYLVVAKVVPGAWLATAFVAAAGAALLFFILMLISLLSGGDTSGVAVGASTDAALVAEAESLRGQLEDVTKARDEALAIAERTYSEDDDGAAKLAALREAASQTQAELTKRIQDLTQQLAAEKAKAPVAPVVAPGDDRAAVVRERDAARSQAESHKKQIVELVQEIARLRKENKTLEESKPVGAVASATTAKGPAAAGASRADAPAPSAAPKVTDKEAKELYAQAMAKTKKAKTHEEGITLLDGARRAVAGTRYEQRLKDEIERRTVDKANRDARVVYEDVLARIRKTPKAYVENLGALNVALAKVNGTKYEKALSRLIESRRKSMKDDVGRAAYDDARKRLKEAPKEREKNLEYLEVCRTKAVGSNYEASIEKLIKSEKAALEKQRNAEAKK
jgi:hypothetical protein